MERWRRGCNENRGRLARRLTAGCRQLRERVSTVMRTVTAELEDLRRAIEGCTECPLVDSSTRVVFGEGDPTSPLVIVGEGPGEREDLEGHPFVGRAGQLLEKLLGEVGLSRGELWITNVLKRRASKIVDGKVKNRLPRADELAVYKDFLDREMKILAPRIVVCLGNLSANALIHRNFRMTKEHGQWFSGASGKRLVASYHPAYILRLEGSDYDEVFRQTVEDLSSAATEYRILREEQHSSEPAQATSASNARTLKKAS